MVCEHQIHEGLSGTPVKRSGKNLGCELIASDKSGIAALKVLCHKTHHTQPPLN